MRQTFNHDTKTISVFIEKGDAFIEMNNIADYVVDGYKIRVFDIEGKELPEDSDFKISLREQHRDRVGITLPKLKPTSSKPSATPQ